MSPQEFTNNIHLHVNMSRASIRDGRMVGSKVAQIETLRELVQLVRKANTPLLRHAA